ncbi:MAG: DUF4412 domain-containing protein [Holophagales bacterium]|nr:DUF4412 domain-containing protein [Holophagales bacterium]
MKMVVLSRTAEPDISYMINDAQKSYARIDVKEMQKSLPKAEQDKKWTVKRLGPDSVAGFACQKALVTQEGETSENEVCISKDILGPASMFNSGRRGAGGQGLEVALKANGLEGMPIRMIMREKGKAEASMKWELVNAEKRSLPASTFEVPGRLQGDEHDGHDDVSRAAEADGRRHEEPHSRAEEDDGRDDEEGRQEVAPSPIPFRSAPPPVFPAAVARSGRLQISFRTALAMAM